MDDHIGRKGLDESLGGRSVAQVHFRGRRRGHPAHAALPQARQHRGPGNPRRR
ncbi:MAG: hypothetical protein M5U19_22655 [Microthrixaceae bacterium]|nr:hypothetical protein [Microthrixaceae bacterium]